MRKQLQCAVSSLLFMLDSAFYTLYPGTPLTKTKLTISLKWELVWQRQCPLVCERVTLDGVLNWFSSCCPEFICENSYSLSSVSIIKAPYCWTVWRSTSRQQPRTTVRQSTCTSSPPTTLPSTSMRTGTSGSITTCPTTTPFEASSKTDSHMCSTSMGVIHPGQYYILFWKQEKKPLTQYCLVDWVYLFSTQRYSLICVTSWF